MRRYRAEAEELLTQTVPVQESVMREDCKGESFLDENLLKENLLSDSLTRGTIGCIGRTQTHNDISQFASSG
jgi:hypothetical protein